MYARRLGHFFGLLCTPSCVPAVRQASTTSVHNAMLHNALTASPALLRWCWAWMQSMRPYLHALAPFCCHCGAAQGLPHARHRDLRTPVVIHMSKLASATRALESSSTRRA
ncbi:hypothetical protein BDY21DRAFT_56522 [Lineolata rhizophorae]|uniref:Secreted protein n=1 Tax=Lineolata rhizophorae TaxID=578093 RepID=A0A6A6NWP6_9PEZI|nr:hypothetical protein BDY21DRAFT_56522 [Lineolata rhizophorae]